MNIIQHKKIKYFFNKKILEYNIIFILYIIILNIMSIGFNIERYHISLKLYPEICYNLSYFILSTRESLVSASYLDERNYFFSVCKFHFLL